MSKTLKIQATEPQARFHALTCKYPLFVGGFGSGKSEAMLNQAIMDALVHPDAIIALFEPTYLLMEDILIDRLMGKLRALDLYPNHIKSKKRILTKHPQCGTFILRTLDNPDKIVGYTAYRSHVDEIDTLPMDKADQAWKQIQARNRQLLPGVDDCFNRVSAYSTPEGFNFTHDQWVTNKTQYHEFVRGPTSSNPFLPDDYEEVLRATYPENLCKAYLEGEWVNLTSGQVYDSYNAELHDTSEMVQGDENLFVGIDFNITKMAATIYVKRAANHESPMKNVIWHAVDEISDAYDTEEVIEILKERYPKNRITFYPDSTGTQRKGMGKSVAKSYIAMLEDAGYTCLFNRTNPLIKDRVVSMNNALEKGLVKINFFNCPAIARCLTQQAYDKHGQPDKTKGTDHQNDATTYPIAYEFPIRRPAAHIPVRFSL